MKTAPALLVALFAAATLSAESSPPPPAAPAMRDTFMVSADTPGAKAREELASAPFFAFGGVGYGGITSDGERVFRRLYAAPDNLFQFGMLQRTGGLPAQMYAMVAFYRLDRPLYVRLKAGYVGNLASVFTMQGCIASESSVEQVLSRIERGEFAAYLPAGQQRLSPSPATAAGKK